MRMILAGLPLLKEVIGWDSRGGWPGSDHGDLISLLDAIEATPVICQPTVLSTAVAVQ